jgi:hypothetical protein
MPVVVDQSGGNLIGQDDVESENELSSHHEESVASPDEELEATPAKPLLKPVFLSKADRETLAQDQ